jgi:hypothetical protein
MKDLLEKILGYLPSYLGDLVQLVTRPKRFIAERNTGRKGDLLKALTFLGISLSVCFILQAPLLLEKDFWTDAGSNGIVFLIATTVLSGVLHIAWKVVGVKLDFQRILITLSYYSAVIALCLVVTSLCQLGILRIFDPRLYNLLLQTGGTVDWRAFFQAEPLSSAPFVFSLILLFTGFTATLIWAIVGWGAYRELGQTTKIRSIEALFLTALLSLPVLTAFFLIGIVV